MAKVLTVLVLFTNVLVLKCQEEEILENAKLEKHVVSEGKPRYSFSYGVSDAKTGDLKTVWESKDGDTVKGHYSVLEPDGSMRTVEYSAGPKSGFKALVKNDEPQPVSNGEGRSMFDEKSYKDYEKVYDFSEEQEYLASSYHPKRTKYPYEALKEYSRWKRPKYPADLEPSDFTHSITIKHPKDESSSGEPESHVDMKNNLYNNILELSSHKAKHPLHPGIPLDTFKRDYEKYSDPTNYDIEKYVSPYSLEQYRLAKLAEAAFKANKYKEYSMFDSHHPIIPDMPAPEKYFDDASPPRPKKKRKPYKETELPYGDLDDYILVPKKKYKKPQRPYETDYNPEAEEDYERPYYATEDDDDRHYKPPREKPAKEVIRKIVKKRKPPLMKILDIWDI